VLRDQEGRVAALFEELAGEDAPRDVGFFRAGRDGRAAVVGRGALAAGETVTGPALVRQPDATTLLEPGDRARVDELGTLVVEIGAQP
jgi:N-methylhydantoinase A/oxoprolinase/acetone carboxylase beta subunit